MAEEVVVKEYLSDAMISSGAALTKRLAEEQWPVDAALWYYKSEPNEWKLLFASPVVPKEGPRTAYEKIQQSLGELPDCVVALQDVTVVDPEDTVVTLLRTALGTVGGGTGIRFSRSAILGRYIEDAYIYLLR